MMFGVAGVTVLDGFRVLMDLMIIGSQVWIQQIFESEEEDV